MILVSYAILLNLVKSGIGRLRDELTCFATIQPKQSRQQHRRRQQLDLELEWKVGLKYSKLFEKVEGGKEAVDEGEEERLYCKG